MKPIDYNTPGAMGVMPKRALKLKLGKPKPTKQPKGKKRQRVYVRYQDGSYAIAFRSEVGDNAEKVYALGTKYTGEHAALVDILDKLCSEIVRRRDGYRCVICGSVDAPQCGHVFVRGCWGTRFDLDNLSCICGTCNYKDSLQKYRHIYLDWYRGRFGVAKYEALRLRSEARSGGKDWTVPDLRSLLEYYEGLYERLQTLAVFDEAAMKEMGLFGRHERMNRT